MRDDDPEIDDEIAALFVDVGEADKTPPRWVVEKILPVGINFLVGPPKAYKSTIEVALACTVAGVPNTILPPELSIPGQTGHVLGFSAEATAGELRQMAEDGLGVVIPPDGRFRIAKEPFQWRLDDPGAVERLLQWLNHIKPKLFFIDPLRDFHDFDERESGPMNRLLRPLQRWAKEEESAFLVVHHTRKQGTNEEARNLNAADIRGSSALFGLADGVIVLTPRGRNTVNLHATIKRGESFERVIRLDVWGAPEVLPQWTIGLVTSLLSGVEFMRPKDVTPETLTMVVERLTHFGILNKAGKPTGQSLKRLADHTAQYGGSNK